MENSNINLDVLALLAKRSDYPEKTAISCTCKEAYEVTRNDIEEIRTIQRTEDIFHEIFYEEDKDLCWVTQVFGHNPTDLQLEWCGKVYEEFKE